MFPCGWCVIVCSYLVEHTNRNQLRLVAEITNHQNESRKIWFLFFNRETWPICEKKCRKSLIESIQKFKVRLFANESVFPRIYLNIWIWCGILRRQWRQCQWRQCRWRRVEIAIEKCVGTCWAHSDFPHIFYVVLPNISSERRLASDKFSTPEISGICPMFAKVPKMLRLGYLCNRSKFVRELNRHVLVHLLCQ